MKKKVIIILLFALWIGMIIPATVNAASKKATKVTAKRAYTTNSKEYMTVRGTDQKGRLVWSYKTAKYTATELDKTKMVQKGSRVYVFEGSKIVALSKNTGKKLWTRKKLIPAGYAVGFDSLGNIYVGGYYVKDIYKVSASGKLLWKCKLNKNYCWVYKIKISGKKVIVYGYKNNGIKEMKKGYIYLNTKNGKKY